MARTFRFALDRAARFRLLGGVALAVSLALVAGCGGGSKQKAGVSGGEATFEIQSDIDFADPALAYSTIAWQIEYGTCLKLLNYPDKPLPAASRLVPDAATALPTVSDGGRRYAFTIRSGYRFSPPSAQTVSAETFRFSIERVLNPTMRSPGAGFVSDIVGAAAYNAGKAKHVSGIVAQGMTLTITLTRPTPDFLARMALPFFCALPTSTPLDSHGVRAPSSAGPYYIASWTPGHSVIVKRNPNYGGKRPANLDQITYRVGTDPNQALLAVEKGQSDFLADGLPPGSHLDLKRRYGAGSAAAKAGDQRYFVNPVLAIRYLALNTSRPLFHDPSVRRAVNYAIDRDAMVHLIGADAGTPTDSYLPPGVPGSQPVHVYPNTPDLAKARALMHGRTGTAQLYTCDASPCPETAQLIQADLAKIGITVVIHTMSRSVQISREGTRGEPFDIGVEGWTADYNDPYDFINVLLGAPIGASNNTDLSYFSDPVYRAEIDAASHASGAARAAAYAQLNRKLVSGPAPWAAWGIDNAIDFFSARIGCQVFNPAYGMDIANLCLRRS